MAGTALIMLGLAVPAAQASPGDVNSSLVLWQMLCMVDHFGPNDPIVLPGQPGVSHMHSFYGNITTNAYSTTASLLAAPSSCGRNMQTSDHSAYWIPSLYKKNPDGSLTLVKYSGQLMFIYYGRPGGVNGPKIQPFPPGLKMVAGNDTATSPQPLYVVHWDCGGGGPEYSSIPQCSSAYGQGLHAEMYFPSCWDGKHLDSPDHKSHMAYADPVTGACPASHPVSLPQISFEIWYNIAGGPQYVLSSSGPYTLPLQAPSTVHASRSPYTMHGDFFAAWDPQVQNALVAACLNAGQHCIDVTRVGGELTAGDSSQISIKLADYSANSPVVPVQTTPAPAKSAHARTAATTPAKPSAIAIMPAAPATTRPAPSAPATKPALALPTRREVGVASGAVGVSLLAFAAYELRRRLRRPRG